MKRPATLLWFFLAPSLYFAATCEAEIPVEPYSSKPTAAEMAFVAQWKQFLLKQGNADAGRYVADLPFSFQCGERSSREWVKIETANIESGDWQDDKTRTHTLTLERRPDLACLRNETDRIPGFSRLPVGCPRPKRRTKRFGEGA